MLLCFVDYTALTPRRSPRFSTPACVLTKECWTVAAGYLIVIAECQAPSWAPSLITGLILSQLPEIGLVVIPF